MGRRPWWGPGWGGGGKGGGKGGMGQGVPRSTGLLRWTQTSCYCCHCFFSKRLGSHLGRRACSSMSSGARLAWRLLAGGNAGLQDSHALPLSFLTAQRILGGSEAGVLASCGFCNKGPQRLGGFQRGRDLFSPSSGGQRPDHAAS